MGGKGAVPVGGETETGGGSAWDGGSMQMWPRGIIVRSGKIDPLQTLVGKIINWDLYYDLWPSWSRKLGGVEGHGRQDAREDTGDWQGKHPAPKDPRDLPPIDGAQVHVHERDAENSPRQTLGC